MIEINIPINEKGVKKSKRQLIREVVEELKKSFVVSDSAFRLVKYKKNNEAITLQYDILKGRLLKTDETRTSNPFKSPYKEW